MTKQDIPPDDNAILATIYLQGPEGTEKTMAAVDTGATYCILPTKMIEAVGYPLKHPDRVQRVTGVTLHDIPIFTVDNITSNRYSVPRCPVGAFDLPRQSRIKALLGPSFLRHFRFTLDMPGGFYALRYSPYYGLRR